MYVTPTLAVCDMAGGLFCDGAGLEAESWFVTVWLAVGGRLANLGAVGCGVCRPAPRASLFGCQRNECRQIHTLYDLGPVHILHLYFFVFIIFLFF